MAEQLINSFTVNRPIDEAWPLITDVERIAPCLPGAELQEVEGETYRGVVKVKLGAISSQFKGEAHFIERDDANYRAVIKGAGRDTGGRGNASAEITAQAQSLSPTSTRVDVTTDLHITGKVAQFGRGIMGDVSSKLMAQFADNLNHMIDEEGLGAPAAVPTTPEVSDPAGELDATSAGEPDAASDGAAATPPKPQVRKIEGPATEPIDLMEVGGSSIVKRLAPAVIALIVLLLVLRRRRR
jgi:carbon monoxide dehydrogenase subunit G